MEPSEFAAAIKRIMELGSYLGAQCQETELGASLSPTNKWHINRYSQNRRHDTYTEPENPSGFSQLKGTISIKNLHLLQKVN